MSTVSRTASVTFDASMKTFIAGSPVICVKSLQDLEVTSIVQGKSYNVQHLARYACLTRELPGISAPADETKATFFRR